MLAKGEGVEPGMEADEIRLKQMMLMDKKMASRTERDLFFVPIFMSKLP